MRTANPILNEPPFAMRDSLAWEEFITEHDEYDQQDESLPIRNSDGSIPVFLNVYELWQHFGGPEEGGWWYLTGDPVESILVRDYEDALVAFRRIAEEYPKQTDYPYHSTIYSGGCFALQLERKPAEAWPKKRPHYE